MGVIKEGGTEGGKEFGEACQWRVHRSVLLGWAGRWFSVRGGQGLCSATNYGRCTAPPYNHAPPQPSPLPCHTHTEASFSKWRGGRRRRARQHVSGLVPTAVEMAQSSWLRVSSYFSGVPADAAAADDDADGGSEGEEGLLPQLAPKLPEPAGTLSLTVQNIKLCTAPTSDGFFVLKCGPHWGRSRTLSMAGEVVAGGARC